MCIVSIGDMAVNEIHDFILWFECYYQVTKINARTTGYEGTEVKVCIKGIN